VGVTGKVLKAQLRRRYPKLEEFAPGDGDTTTALDG
jgi:hypothetical protein